MGLLHKNAEVKRSDCLRTSPGEDTGNLRLGRGLTAYRKYAIDPMPAIHVVFYQDKPGDSPVVNWLRELNATQPKAFDKCLAAMARLSLLGHELRRPEADYLRDGIYELRIRRGSVNYRLLYFFHGRTFSVVAHGMTKETAVPAIDIQLALQREAAYTANPTAHTFTGDLYDA